MNYRTLGRTGLHVSEIALGTVSLGADYGLPAPGEFGRPDRRDAIRVIHAGLDAGINLFDTAPAYGDAETFLGEALAGQNDCCIATKVSIPQGASAAASGRDILASLEKSLQTLKRDALDVVQIHNATVEILQAGEILEVLNTARLAGKLRFIGISVYTEQEALAGIETGGVDMIQIAFNLLDQRKATTVLPAAKKNNVGVLTRSALLKGALSAKALHLPEELVALKNAADRARRRLNVSWNDLPMAAVRFCLDFKGIDSVLIGPRTEVELKQSLSVLKMPGLADEFMGVAEQFGLTDEHLVNPALWPVK